MKMALYPWQQQDWQRVQSLRSRLPGALLLHAPQGSGKVQFARTLAQALLCQTPDTAGLPCGQCQSCHWWCSETHPDFREIQPREPAEGKKNRQQINIDQIRALTDFVQISSHQTLRIILIHPAEAMNLNAANALLKNLEEPPSNVLFLLVSHQPRQLLPTILSRCLKIVLSAPDVTQATDWLQQQNIDHPEQKLAASGFSPLLALQQDEQLDLSLRQQLFQELGQLKKLNVFALSEQLQNLSQLQLVIWMQQWCYDLMLYKLMGRLRYCEPFRERIQRQTQQFSVFHLMQAYALLLQARTDAQHTLNSRLFMESLLLSYRQTLCSGLENG